MGSHRESNPQIAHLGDIQQELLSSSLLSGSWKRQQVDIISVCREIYVNCDHAELMAELPFKELKKLPEFVLTNE